MTASWQQALGDQRLLVSGFGRWGGGVYDLTSGAAVALDNIPTSGLTLGGGRLWRALRAPGEQTAACEVMSYDARGLRSYERYDTIRDPHDLCWHDGALHVSSSWDGIVWRVEPGHDPIVVWQGGSVPDSWHVNSLLEVDGRLHVCAFGRFDRHKAWKTEDNATSGMVHDTVRGVDVLRRLAHPHHPRWTGDGWLLCESTRGTLTECDVNGRVLRRVAIERFSRGLAVLGRWALVGGNAHRDEEDDRAEMAVVDLRSFEVVDRVALPCLEIYDILATPFEMARGLALGFGANPARAVEQHRGSERDAPRASAPDEARLQLVTPRAATTLATAGQPLDKRQGRRCEVGAVGELPSATTMAAGELRRLPVTVGNRSSVALATVPPHPIRVGVRWLRLDDDPPAAGDGRQNVLGQPGRRRARRSPMAALPRLLHPGDHIELEVLMEAPDEPGHYEARVALHQKGQGWFGRRLRFEVTVVPADRPLFEELVGDTQAISRGGR